MSEKDSPIHVLWLPTILAAGITYIVSVLDLIPGFGPISWLDDLAVFIGLVWFFTSWLPKNRHRIYWHRPRQESRSHSENGARTRAGLGKNGEAEFDPFDVLNVRPGASDSEIKRAYREMLAKYHPDKVTHLGKEFQHIAHEKVIEIKRAYEMLHGKG